MEISLSNELKLPLPKGATYLGGVDAAGAAAQEVDSQAAAAARHAAGGQLVGAARRACDAANGFSHPIGIGSSGDGRQAVAWQAGRRLWHSSIWCIQQRQ